MTLTVREELKSRLSETTFIGWTKREFEDLLCRTQHARIKKDGTFYKNDKELISNNVKNYIGHDEKVLDHGVRFVCRRMACADSVLSVIRCDEFRFYRGNGEPRRAN